MKVALMSEEWWPVWTLRDADGVWDTADVPAEQHARWSQAVADFRQAQREMAAAAGDTEPDWL